ncbi:hypothetical protein M0R45_018267 [Rubus argutus]|uniref:S-protein homolog n=1 Tax=Rubus argutus TaxID=59490 RepID=A0AAW1X1W4_RUBAR
MASFIGRTVMLMLLMLLLTITCDAKTHVRIINDIGGGLDLTVHCKSADDDIGVKVLRPQEWFEFSFKPAWIIHTDYYCSFKFPAGSVQWLDVYDEKRDLNVCMDCWWSIKSSSDGPCRFNWINKKYDYCLPWNKD